MVPASTLMYGSIFWSVTRRPRASRSEPMEAAASPLPRDDTTPPVTKMNFVLTSGLLSSRIVPGSGCGGQPPRHARSLLVDTLHDTAEAKPAQHRQTFAHRRAAGHAEGDHVFPRQQRPHGVSLAQIPGDATAGRRAPAKPGAGGHRGRRAAQGVGDLAPPRSPGESLGQGPRSDRRLHLPSRLADHGEPVETASDDRPALVHEQADQIDLTRVERERPRHGPEPLDTAQARSDGPSGVISAIPER